MKHELKAGVIPRGGFMYYTCKFGMGHKVHPITKSGELKPITVVETVMISHARGQGVLVSYVCADNCIYSEDEVHLTQIDAKIQIHRNKKLATA